MGQNCPNNEMVHTKNRRNHLWSPTWWFIPLGKWLITPVASVLTLLIPHEPGIFHVLRIRGMSHQAGLEFRPIPISTHFEPSLHPSARSRGAWFSVSTSMSSWLRRLVMAWRRMDHRLPRLCVDTHYQHV